MFTYGIGKSQSMGKIEPADIAGNGHVYFVLLGNVEAQQVDRIGQEQLPVDCVWFGDAAVYRGLEGGIDALSVPHLCRRIGILSASPPGKS